MKEINNASQESSKRAFEKCPHCGSTDTEHMPEMCEGSFRLYSCNSCLKGFVVVEASCPYCQSEDVSLCYAGEGSFEAWACNKCKKGFTKGTPME